MDGAMSTLSVIVLIGAALGAVIFIMTKLRSAFKTIDRIEGVVTIVEREFRKNGGGTLKDALDRLEARQETNTRRIKAIEEQVFGEDYE